MDRFIFAACATVPVFLNCSRVWQVGVHLQLGCVASVFSLQQRCSLNSGTATRSRKSERVSEVKYGEFHDCAERCLYF
jgi:hypothetical protein